jgi:hypothetical protein
MVQHCHDGTNELRFVYMSAWEMNDGGWGEENGESVSRSYGI